MHSKKKKKRSNGENIEGVDCYGDGALKEPSSQLKGRGQCGVQGWLAKAASEDRSITTSSENIGDGALKESSSQLQGWLAKAASEVRSITTSSSSSFSLDLSKVTMVAWT